MTDPITERTPVPAPSPSAGVSLGDLRDRLLAVGIDARLDAALAEIRVTSLAFHTGRVVPGGLFAALPGATSHGMDFADEAEAAGAVAVLSDRAHPRGLRVPDAAAAVLALGRDARERWRGPVVGVTGSAGKTTTRALLGAALEAHATEGNYNTPLALAATMATGAWQGRIDGPLVLELGIDRVGEMDELVDLTRPDVGVLTRVAASHLESLGTVATVAREKGRLLERSAHGVASASAAAQLPAGLRGRIRAYRLASDGASSAGLDADASPPDDALERTDVARLDVGRLEERGADSGPGPTRGETLIAFGRRFALPFRGRVLAENALGALAVADLLGVDLDAAGARIAAVELEPGRLQLRPWAGQPGAWILDDSYNSSPVAAAEALRELRRLPAPRTAVLGSMLELGPDSPAYHEALGRAARGLDRVLAVGDEARAIVRGHPDATWVPDAATALDALRGTEPRGSILIKGSRGIGLDAVADALARETG